MNSLFTISWFSLNKKQKIAYLLDYWHILTEEKYIQMKIGKAQIHIEVLGETSIWQGFRLDTDYRDYDPNASDWSLFIKDESYIILQYEQVFDYRGGYEDPSMTYNKTVASIDGVDYECQYCPIFQQKKYTGAGHLSTNTEEGKYFYNDCITNLNYLFRGEEYERIIIPLDENSYEPYKKYKHEFYREPYYDSDF